MVSSGGNADVMDELAAKKLLEELRNNPVNTGGSTDEYLKKCLDFVDSKKPRSGPSHLYCSRTTEVVREAATFLIRLQAYQNSQAWKERLIALFRECLDCVRGYAEARGRSDKTYLSSFAPNTLRRFNETIDKWQSEIVLASFRDAVASSNPLPSFSLYHALTNLAITQNPEVRNFIIDNAPTNPYTDWPKEPPPGLLLLRLDTDERVREWVRKQWSHCVPLTKNESGSPHMLLLSILAKRLQSGDMNHASSITSTTSTPPPSQQNDTILPPLQLWSPLPDVLKLTLGATPFKTIRNLDGVDLVKLIEGHLHDNDKHFPHVLRSFIRLLQTFGPQLWENEASEYPQVKIDAIRDNPTFDQLIQKNTQPALQVFDAYLTSVWKLDIFSEALAKTVAFMCGDLLHPRYETSCRSKVMLVLAQILRSVHQKAKSEMSARHLVAFRETTGIHAQSLSIVAFSREYKGDVWADARAAMRVLFQDVLAADASELHELVIRLSVTYRNGPSSSVKDLGNIPFQIHEAMWNRLYGSLATDDGEAMALLIRVIAISAHLDALDMDVYHSSSRNPSEELKRAYRTEVKTYNQALEIIRKGFSYAMTNYAGNVRRATLQEFLQRNEVVGSLMAVMFSPSEELQSAAQELAMQAYDVEGRDGSFKAYIQCHPGIAFKGIFSTLRTVNTAVESFIEACTISRSTVLCLTDIIDILCAKPEGLFWDSTFSDIHLPEIVMELWSSMAEVISSIFKRTPAWAPYKDTDWMVIWMRDALLFARDMVKQYTVFHSVASDTLRTSQVGPSPVKAQKGKMNKTDKVMMGKMEITIGEIIKWLKLTDPELLHQSVQLLRMTLKCFEEGSVRPPQASLDRLEGIVEKGEGGGKNHLTRDHIRTIGEAISPWVGIEEKSEQEGEEEEEESDDGIEFVGMKTVTKEKEKKEKAKTKIDDFFGASSKGKGKEKATSSKPPEPAKPKMGIMKTSSSKSGSTQGSSKLKEIRDQVRQQQQWRTTSTSTISAPLKPAPQPVSKGEAKSAPTSEKEDEGEEESESEDSDEGGMEDLVKMQKSPKKPKIPAPPVRRGIVMLGGDVKTVAKQRYTAREEARRTQLRLKPDLNPLHRLILSWDYDHTGEDPPHPKNLPPPRFSPIPDSFQNHDQYRSILEPLLALECWSQVVKAKEEPQEETTWEIAGKQYVDEWLELDLATTDQLPTKWFLSETDVVLLRPTGSQNRSIMAKVQSFKQSVRGCLASARCRPPSEDIGLTVRTKWRLTKVFSLSTVHREYAALIGLPYYDLFDRILRPQPAKLPRHDSSINVSVKDLSLDALVATKMNAEPGKDITNTSSEIAELRKELQKVNADRLQKIAEFQNTENNSARSTLLDTEIKALNAKRSSLNNRLNQARDKEKDSSRALDAAKRRFRQEVLAEADVICSTLSGAGHEILELFDFETVVIDEACQSIELSSLIPLKYRCKRCIMVGDPQQLAPTVLSRKASKFNYEQSLFVRIQKHRPEAVHLLSIQYRMHPVISILPSKVFYSGRLQDGPDMAQKTAQPWHKESLFGPYRFFNVSQGQESSSGSHSLINSAEVDVAIALYNRVRLQFSPNGELDTRIGVVTMYRGQMLELRRRFISRFGTDITSKVDFNTVDGFQGQEKDIIILSCVRAGPSVERVGFLADVRRMNVALTRSRSSLFVLGHASTLERGDHTWKRIVEDARERLCLVDGVSRGTFEAPTLVKVPAAVAPKPSKKSASKSIVDSTASLTLMPPSEMKKSHGAATAASMKSPTDPQPSSSNTKIEDTTKEEHPDHVGYPSARDGDVEMAEDTTSSSLTAPREPPKSKPRLPPPKPKGGPSLFIPSKRPPKRPAENDGPGDSVGSSSIKRRLAAEVRDIYKS
ncbi:DEAD-box type RNA helicase [Tulasnella sp. 418]|nr:DEAD-box type RNA helicase [Tulasnella sp. 418]